MVPASEAQVVDACALSFVFERGESSKFAMSECRDRFGETEWSCPISDEYVEIATPR